MNRRKWLGAVFGILVLCAFPAYTASARQAVDPERESSLTMTIRNTRETGEEERIAGVEIRLYRIADIDRTSEYHWSEGYTERAEDLNSLTQDGWKDLADTLWREVRTGEKEPFIVGSSNTDGVFSVTGMKPGLYLFAGPETGGHEKAGNEHEYYTPLPGIVSLPGLVPGDPDEAWQYDVAIFPKMDHRDPEPEDVLVVQKRWRRYSREPVSIQVLRDNEVFREFSLTEEEGWKKRIVLGDGEGRHEWSIREAPVAGYHASYSREGMLFTVTNIPDGSGSSNSVKRKTVPKEDPPVEETSAAGRMETKAISPALPQTGHVWWPVPFLLAIGVMLMYIGTWQSRAYGGETAVGGWFKKAGIAMVCAAFAFAGYNALSAAQAGKASEKALEELAPVMLEAESADIPALPGEEPAYVLNPDIPMPEESVGGNSYIGTLDIIPLSITLPVMSRCDYKNLKTAPCRYSGSAYQDDMVICAHNYAKHFSGIKRMHPGDRLRFTDIKGNVFEYEVTDAEVLRPDEVQKMTEGDGQWDMTLFTCTTGGQSRFALRCKKLCRPGTALNDRRNKT